MEINKTIYQNRFTLVHRKSSKETDLSWQIAKDIKMPVQVPRKWINQKGFQPVFTIYSELKKSGKLSKELFLWSAARLPDKKGYIKLGKQLKLKL